MFLSKKKKKAAGLNSRLAGASELAFQNEPFRNTFGQCNNRTLLAFKETKQGDSARLNRGCHRLLVCNKTKDPGTFKNGIPFFFSFSKVGMPDCPKEMRFGRS